MMNLISKIVPAKTDIPVAAAPEEPKSSTLALVTAKLKTSGQVDMPGIGEVRRDGMIRF